MSTQTTPEHIPNAHLFRSPMFVNFPWRTSIFDQQDLRYLASHGPDHWKNFIMTKITESGTPITDATKQFLRSAAARVDEYVASLISSSKRSMDLGLVENSPGSREYGYTLKGPDRTPFWQAFSCCVITDRILWAYDICTRTPQIQYRHAAVNFQNPYPEKSYDESIERINRAHSTFLVENVDQGTVAFPKDSEENGPFQTGLLVGSAAAYDIRADYNSVLANLCWVAATCFFLAHVR